MDHAQNDIAVVQTDSASTVSEESVQVNAGVEEELSWYRKLFDVFEKSPLLVVILYIVIIYSIIVLITLTIYILFNRSKIANMEELKQDLNERYQQLLIDYLFDEEGRNNVFREVRRIANNSYNRQILINQILELSINMEGKSKEDLRLLYLDLGLKRDSVRKAYSRKWHENVKGFRELAFMNIRSENERLIECLNSHNQILRMEAQISLVRLSEDNPYTFLDFLEKPLSVWEQITMHELLTQHKLTAPDFSKWFESENLSIVIFSLKMTAWFKQTDSVKGVVRMLHHDNERVRKTAIEACGDLGLKEPLPYLVKMYKGESYLNRMEILRAFGKVPDEEYLDFLNRVLDDEDDVQLQILATKAMENTDEPGISRLIKLMKSKSEYKNYQIIIRHVLDGRIY